MGNRPENTLGTNAPLESNPLRAIDLVCNEDYSADRLWFFTDQEMREYLCGQRAAYANDTGVVRDRDGVIGTWYVAEMVAWNTGPCLSEELDNEEADRLEMQDMPHEWQSDWGFNRKMVDATEPLTDTLGEAIDAAMETLGRNRMVAKARERFINSGNTPDPDNEESGDRNYVMSQEQYDRDFDEWVSGKAKIHPGVDQRADLDFIASQQGPVILTGEELPCVGSDEGCQCEECSNLTEDEKMAQAGMSDEEIAAVNHIDRIQDELDKARTCIGSLLAKLDGAIGLEMHWYGNTPSWYVEAAAISCGITLEDEDLGGLPIPNSPDQRKPVPGRFWREEEMANAKAFDEALAAAKERLNGLPF